MVRPNVVVIGESPSLADALVELFSAEGWNVDAVGSIEQAADRTARHAHAPVPLLVSASNRHRSVTLDRWREGLLQNADLVLVGVRDPSLRSSKGLHIVRLPLQPCELLRLIEWLSAS